MTRKQAIKRTIELINFAAISKEEQEELVKKLNGCLEELPFTKWTEAAIFDACDQFVLENHRNIRTTDFARPGLPNHTVIKNRFHMTAKEFRDQYYPPLAKGAGRYLEAENAQRWRALFIADFHRVKPAAQAGYNCNRAEGLPTWVTVAKMFGLRSWSALLAHCGLEPYRGGADRRGVAGYTVTTTSKSEQKILELESKPKNTM